MTQEAQPEESKSEPQLATKSPSKNIWFRVVTGGAILLAALALGAWLVVYFVQKPDRNILTIYGNVDIRDVNMGFRVPGRIAAVLKDEGDRGARGELIAQLDPAIYQDALAEKAAAVEVKKAALKDSELIYQRNQSLIKEKVTSKQEFDDSLSSRDQAAANLKLAVAEMASAKTDLDDTEIHSPADGVIITRSQEPGAIVLIGNSVLTLSLDHPIWVRAYIPETNLGEVHPGKEVQIFTDTHPKHPYHGKVGYISPEAEFTPKTVETAQLRTSLVYRLRIVVDDSDPSLRQGMPVTIKIHLP
jgi:HlyD family secretion protein